MQKIINVTTKPLSVVRIYMDAVTASIAEHGESVWVHPVKPTVAVRKAQRGVLVPIARTFTTVSFEGLATVIDV